MMTWIFVGAVLLIAALIGLALYSCYRAGREDGYEQGHADALEADHAERTAAPGRHRMSHPRVSSPSPELAPADAQPEPTPGLAWNIDTVLLAPQPSPHLTGAADTGTMTKVSITSTGDMPVLTDSFIADLELREAAYRKEHAESEA